MKIILVLYTCVSLFALLSSTTKANQADNLEELILSKRSSKNKLLINSWEEEDVSKQLYFVSPQEGIRQADKISALPGQPYGVNFDQYSGYVIVDPKAGRALFYYFVESPYNPSTKPLVLWLNGVANVLFLESPAGVGFSYSNTTSDYDRAGNKFTANDAYVFLINWLERFPEYKSRDFFITGESYAGHYVPQLAYTILIGNAWIDDETGEMGIYDYLWTHALNSYESHADIIKYCDFAAENVSNECANATRKALLETGNIDWYNIYAPICRDTSPRNGPPGSVYNYDPCSDYYVEAYINIPEVQLALHTIPTNWTHCSYYNWTDSPSTILPTIKYLMESGIRVWVYSGDTDGRVPVTSSRYSINRLNLPVEVPWRAWYSGNEVGGYVEQYKGLTFVTVRGAGHTVPSWQPARALTLITSFLKHTLPPSSPWPYPWLFSCLPDLTRFDPISL